MDLLLIKQPRVFPNRWIYQKIKRVLDVVMCLVMLPFLIPLVFICAVAIAVDSKGPVLFIQERIGRGGKSFRLYKFRTMEHDLDFLENRAYMKAYVRGEIRDEPGIEGFKPIHAVKITRVGRFLRKISLDEIPQIINVIRGEMSIIGPRPNVTWEVDEYKPWHHERMEVLPGITGLAQIRGRSCIDFNTLVRYDVEYIEKQCFSLDLQILVNTFITVIKSKGAM